MDVQYLKYADITLTDGTVLNLTSANLWANGFSFEDSVSGDSSFAPKSFLYILKRRYLSGVF